MQRHAWNASSKKNLIKNLDLSKIVIFPHIESTDCFCVKTKIYRFIDDLKIIYDKNRNDGG